MVNRKYMHRFKTTISRLDYEDNPSTYTEPYLSVVEENKLTVYYNKSDAETGYLKFIQLGGNGGTIGISGGNGGVNLEYSFDGKTWNTLTSVFLNNGESILVKGNNTTIFPVKFNMTGLVRASGNIMSLLYGDSFRDKTTIPTEGCFREVFKGCTSLTHAPTLPATILMLECYREMFANTSIVNFPTLPADHVSFGSYMSMFSGCTNLRGIGYISAISYDNHSFDQIFYNTDFQGSLTIVRPPNAVWPVQYFLANGVNVTSMPDEEDTVQVQRLYKTCTHYSTQEGSAGNDYYDAEEWYVFRGNHIIDGHRYYLWEKDDNRSSGSERDSFVKHYVITEDRFPTCDLENPYIPVGFLTSDFDACYTDPGDNKHYFVYYDPQEDRLYKEDLIGRFYLGPDYEDWFEYFGPKVINGYTYSAWKKMTASAHENSALNGSTKYSHSYVLFDTFNPVCSGSNPIFASGYLLRGGQTVYDELGEGGAGVDFFIKYDNRTLGWKRWCRAVDEESNAYADFFTIDGYSIKFDTLNEVFVEQLESVQGVKLIVGYDGLLNINLELLSYPSSLVRELDLIGTLKCCRFWNIRSLQTLNLENSSIDTIDIIGCPNLSNIVYSPHIKYVSRIQGTAISEFVLPSTVKYIERYAFMNSNNLTNITLPGGLVSIGGSAFEGCTSLEDITIPSSVISIEYDAFKGSGLRRAVVNAKLGILLSYVFGNCSNLTQVVLPDSLKTIDTRCFVNCTQLTQIELPEGLVSIESYAFSNSGLTSIQLPVGISLLKSNVFYQCTNLTSVNMLSTTPIQIEASAFRGCSNLEQINLNKVTTIGSNSFYGCNLNTIEIDNITSIGSNAFEDCISLTNISLTSSATRVVIQSSSFRRCNNIRNVYINCTGFSNSIFSGSSLNNVEEVTLGPKCTEIPGKFTNFTHLQSVAIQSSNIRTISSSTFSGCTSLTSFEIPSSVTTIEITAFYNSGLTEITIPDSVTAIGKNAFKQCTGLKRVNIGSGLTSMSSGVFENCPLLEYLYVDNSNIGIEDIGLTGTTINVKEIVLGDLVGVDFLEDGRELQEYVSNIESFTFGAGFSRLSNEFFNQCDKLKSVVLGSNMTSIGNNAFFGCTALPSIVIPASVTSIGDYAFVNCINLKDITSKNPTPPTINVDNTFGTSQPGYQYTGRNTYNQNVNKLHVPRGATSYSTAWRSLFVYTQSGFTIAYDG